MLLVIHKGINEHSNLRNIGIIDWKLIYINRISSINAYNSCIIIYNRTVVNWIPIHL